MTPSLRIGHILRGHKGIYTIVKQLQETVWLATKYGMSKNSAKNPQLIHLTFDTSRTENNKSVIIKSVRHFRLQNERDVLRRFQSQTPFLRPLLDEIVDPSDPPAIVLKYLDDNLLDASNSKRLSRREIKYVSRRVLDGLKILHEAGFVHTDIKPDNILVNYVQEKGDGDGDGDVRFTDIQIADCGNTVPADSAYAKDSDVIGAPIWRSPEAQLRIGWGTPTDIWSFGAILITLIYGDNFFIFKPNVPADHEEYELKILERQCEFFGPFPLTYREICPPDLLNVLAHVMQSISSERKKPFSRITEKEVCKEDKDFILKIMRLDPRDRPTATELLQDEWFCSG